jgi:hypothetical protein
MGFMLVSKNNMGVAATLILVILLSQSRFFNFLIETALGRAFLILFILVISYVNKMLGVVAVLFIVIMFNNSNIGYMEGFTGTSETTGTTGTTGTSGTDNKDDKPKPKEMSSGREGFNTTDRELNMLRGKRSNEVPVLSTARSQSEDVDPTDMSIFKDTLSTF